LIDDQASFTAWQDLHVLTDSPQSGWWRLCEAAKHDAAHGGVDHCDACFGQAFIVAGQTTGTGKPGKNPFHDLPARDDLETFGLFFQPIAPRPASTVERDLDTPASGLIRPLREQASVRAIGPDEFMPRQSDR
jgi:hypothetical protein